MRQVGLFHFEPAGLTSMSTTTAYGADTQVTITAGSESVYYNQGVNPSVPERVNYQTTPGTLNATAIQLRNDGSITLCRATAPVASV